MEQMEKSQREIDIEEIKRMSKQLLIGAGIVLVGLIFMGIGEMICRWLEGI